MGADMGIEGEGSIENRKGSGTGASKLTLEEELKEKGFKSITGIASLHFTNPIPEYMLEDCLKELVYHVSEDRTIIKDFAILPNRESRDNELAYRGWYRVYVLPAD